MTESRRLLEDKSIGTTLALYGSRCEKMKWNRVKEKMPGNNRHCTYLPSLVRSDGGGNESAVAFVLLNAATLLRINFAITLQVDCERSQIACLPAQAGNVSIIDTISDRTLRIAMEFLLFIGLLRSINHAKKSPQITGEGALVGVPHLLPRIRWRHWESLGRYFCEFLWCGHYLPLGDSGVYVCTDERRKYRNGVGSLFSFGSEHRDLISFILECSGGLVNERTESNSFRSMMPQACSPASLAGAKFLV